MASLRRALRIAEATAPCLTGDTRVTLADGSERTLESLYEQAPEGLWVPDQGVPSYRGRG